MKKMMILMNCITNFCKSYLQAKKLMLLCFTFFIFMETQSQTLEKLGYHWGSSFYLIDKKAYQAYLTEMQENEDTTKRKAHLKKIVAHLYDKIKDIDFDSYAELHKNDPKRYRDVNIVPSLPSQYKIDKGNINYQKEYYKKVLNDFDLKNWEAQSLYSIYKLYFHCLVNETDKFFWFLHTPYHLISMEFLEYVGSFSDRWANIFALEGVKLQSIQIGYKDSEKPKKEINSAEDYNIDDDTGDPDAIMPDSALKKLQEILVNNTPTDIRLEEERTLMLGMIARCLSGECYMVMVRL
jgi:hypothetical protein